MAFKMRGFPTHSASAFKQTNEETKEEREKRLEKEYQEELKKLEQDFKKGVIGLNKFRDEKKILLKKYKKV